MGWGGVRDFYVIDSFFVIEDVFVFVGIGELCVILWLSGGCDGGIVIGWCDFFVGVWGLSDVLRVWDSGCSYDLGVVRGVVVVFNFRVIIIIWVLGGVICILCESDVGGGVV